MFWPIVTPLRTLTLTPSQTSLSITTGIFGPVRESLVCQSVSVMRVFAPHRTFSPIVILAALLITVPLKPQLGPILISAPSVRVDTMHGRLTPMRLEEGDDLNTQPAPIMIWLCGCRKRRERPNDEHLEPRLTPHQHAESFNHFVKKCLFTVRQKTSTKCGRLSSSIFLTARCPRYLHRLPLYHGRQYLDRAVQKQPPVPGHQVAWPSYHSQKPLVTSLPASGHRH